MEQLEARHQAWHYSQWWERRRLQSLLESRRAHTSNILLNGKDAGRILVVGGTTNAPPLQAPVSSAPPHTWVSADGSSCGTCFTANICFMLQVSSLLHTQLTQNFCRRQDFEAKLSQISTKYGLLAHDREPEPGSYQ